MYTISYFNDVDDTKPDSNQVQHNIQKLLALSGNSGANILTSEGTEKIVEHILKSKRHYEPKSRNFLKQLKPQKKEEEGSIFSDEDFERLSRELFGNSEPLNRKTIEKKRQNEAENSW